MVRMAHSMLPFALLSPTGLSSCTISVGNVRASFVFDVDDARFLVALQCHFLMTRGQHVVCECSFWVTVTRAFAKYNVTKECFRQSVITSTHEHVVGGGLRQAARTRLGVWTLFAFGTYAIHRLRYGKCVNSSCSTSASFRNTSTVPGLAG